MLKELIKLSNDLDKKGLIKEADYLDGLIISIAEEAEEGERPQSLGAGPSVPSATMRATYRLEEVSGDEAYQEEPINCESDGFGSASWRAKSILYNPLMNKSSAEFEAQIKALDKCIDVKGFGDSIEQLVFGSWASEIEALVEQYKR